MKVRVLKKFKDKEMGEIRRKGEVFECSEKRYAEIMKVNENLISVLDGEETEQDKQETEQDAEVSGSGSLCDIAQDKEHGAGYLDENDLESMNYRDLKQLAKDIGLSAKGSKEELIQRITAEQINY
ncbi:MAG: hypothetical protein HFJ06_03195 [Lachnospiraceae bacterium]|nr:hypothetical protein [Lachnospiraceae bacterium]